MPLPSSFGGNEKARWRKYKLRSGGLGHRSLVVRGSHRARAPKVTMVSEGYFPRMTVATELETRRLGSVEYHVGGSGEPLLLVHGLAGSTGELGRARSGSSSGVTG